MTSFFFSSWFTKRSASGTISLKSMRPTVVSMTSPVFQRRRMRAWRSTSSLS